MGKLSFTRAYKYIVQKKNTKRITMLSTFGITHTFKGLLNHIYIHTPSTADTTKSTPPKKN